MSVSIGEKIRALRKKNGLSQEAFAEKVGVSPQAVSKWENDQATPETALIPVIAGFFRTTTDDLFDFRLPDAEVFNCAKDKGTPAAKQAGLRPLRLGAAYHGNRMPHHAEADLRDMAAHGMNTVVHMLSHTDWERHDQVMEEIVKMSIDAGLEVWIDNWGLGGPPGDLSHFLAYFPDSHMVFSNGDMDRTHVCLNSPDFRRFMREWIDRVQSLGAHTIFWDEPHMPHKTVNGKNVYACACPRCRKLFEEKYGHPMPDVVTDEAADFGTDTIVEYLGEMSAYAASKGLHNAVCVMLGTYGMSLSVADRICALPYMENIGSDPYWIGSDNNVYEYVYNGTKENLRIADLYGKDHNIWIQAYSNPRGTEEEIVVAAEAAYDAGARTLLAWGYYGSESNNYAAKNPLVTWAKTCEAMERVRQLERDRVLEENRRKYRK